MSGAIKPSHVPVKSKKQTGLIRQSKSKKDVIITESGQCLAVVTEEELMKKSFITPDDVIRLSGITKGMI